MSKRVGGGPSDSQQGSPTCLALRLELREDNKMLGKHSQSGTGTAAEREGETWQILCVFHTVSEDHGGDPDVTCLAYVMNPGGLELPLSSPSSS